MWNEDAFAVVQVRADGALDSIWVDDTCGMVVRLELTEPGDADARAPEIRARIARALEVVRPERTGSLVPRRK
jgi:hypothetical protein